MKTWEKIDVEEELSLEDFLTLFSRSPLIDEEKRTLPDYFEMYEMFVSSGVKPQDAWIATKNIFVLKNAQIVERIKSQNNG